MHNGLFDLDFRRESIARQGDPPIKFKEIVDWKLYRPYLDSIREKERKSNAGRKPFVKIARSVNSDHQPNGLTPASARSSQT